MTTTLLHDLDFFDWTQQQAGLLKSRNLAKLDVKHLIQEIESMGASERRELINRLAVLLAHLLKWHYQPSFRGRSWQLTIKIHRRQLQRFLMDNPSLHAKLDEFISDAYEGAILLAAKETGMEESTFPAQYSYAQEDLLSPEYYPDLPH